MDKSYELKYNRLEKNHYWFISRKNIILKLIKKLNLEKNPKILVIGCSEGHLIKVLNQKRFTNIYRIDINESTICLCKDRGTQNVIDMDRIKTKFKDNDFVLIIASDV